jgi:beta-galactosidase
MSPFTRRDLLRSGITASAATLLPTSALVRVNEVLADAAAGSDISSLISPRERLLLDFEWKFFQGNAADPARDLSFGKDQSDFAKSGEFGFATAKLDDSRWRSLNLPHDWAVELPFVHDEALKDHGYKPLGRAYPENSVGWYRRVFDIPKGDSGRRIAIEFDGVFRDALVFLNGYFIGRNNNGYAPFQFDVSDFLNYGGKNYLVVRVEASFGDGWFYEGAGIYRHVWLLKTDVLHLGRWESYVRADLKLFTIKARKGKTSGSIGRFWTRPAKLPPPPILSRRA